MQLVMKSEIPLLDIVMSGDNTFDYEATYYLAGPMSGYPEYNFPEFSNACEILRNADIKIASPHEIDHGETEEDRGSLPYETYMQAGLDLLRTCQGIILLRGWPQSTGACREMSLAIDLGLSAYFFHEPVAWKDQAELTDMNRRPEA